MSTFSTRAAFFAALAVATALFLAPFAAPGEGAGIALDKVAHVLALAFLALLARLAWPERRAAAYAGLVLYAVAVELVQGLTPWRTADAWDALAGAAGALAVFAPRR